MKTLRLIFGLLLCPSLAFALQVIEPVEGHNSFVKLSAKENTRLAVENGKIRSLIMSDGELIVEKDEERGQMFIRPLVLNKPINVRVLVNSGATYNLIMQAVDIPQEDIVIRDALLKDKSRDNGLGWTKSGSNSIEKSIRNLVIAMAQESGQSSIAGRTVNQEIALWEGTKFVQIGQYVERGLTGEKYRLTNVSKEQIRVIEQELYRKGVLAVAIENMVLDPKQSTNIYVIKGN